MRSHSSCLLWSLIGLGWGLAFSPAQAAQVEIGSYEILSRNRIGRTVWEYVMRASAANSGDAIASATATVTSSSPNTVIVEGSLSFAAIGAGATAPSQDTFTLRQDRLAAFDPGALQWSVDITPVPPPVLAIDITSPAEGLLTRQTEITVSGTVGEGVTSVSVNGMSATLGPGTFSALVPVREGRNVLTALARGAANAEGRDSVAIRVDTSAPLLNIEMPTPGQLLSVAQTAVTGMINDIVAGTVNEGDCTVFVNGVQARISNRSYEAREVLLARGDNELVVVALDAAGNETVRQVNVVYQPPAEQQTIRSASGDFQQGVIGSLLDQPLVVEVVDGVGNPIPDLPVTFAVVRNDGVLRKDPLEGREVTTLTDENGLASVRFQLGTRTGAGNNQVSARAAGFTHEVMFCASALPGPATKIAPLTPETQVGTTGQLLPLPWTVYVIDAGGNPVENAEIALAVTEGGGTIDGEAALTVLTDSNGRAAVTQVLGPDPGIYNNVLLATIVGVDSPTASTLFKATAKPAQDALNTRVSGLVLDHVNRPMSNVLCLIETTTIETATDAQGQFLLENVPVGPVRLLVDARDRGIPGEWHMLEFDLVTVAGQDNQVDRPIYMLPLDAENAAIAGGDQDVVLRMKDIPGATLTIYANSVHAPNGERQARVLWTQVNMERVPMPPPLGSQFMLAWTVQPAGLHFDPPASICIPNMGAPPGQQVEIFSFDHDVAEFVAVGTATVTPDGAQMCSDPGFGVMKSGWGGCVPPPPPCSQPPACSGAPADGPCYTWQSVPPASPCDCPTYTRVNKADGTACTDDGKDCTDDVCKAGACTHEPTPPQGPACATAAVTTSYPEHLDQGHLAVGSNFGVTLAHYADLKVETTACLDGNTFRIRVTSATSPVDIDTALQGRQNCDTVVPTAANFCDIVDDLDDQDYSHIPCISSACNLDHERAHKKEWEDNWDARFPALQQSIEQLSIAASDEVCTPEKAKDKLKTQIENLINTVIAAAQAQWNGEGEGVNGEAAEDACNAAKVAAICATANTNNWPACAFCPP